MLSKQALALFREHLEQRGTVDVVANREAYRELARAGLMVAGNSFAGGDESVYHVTREGFERRAELLADAREAVRSPRPRSVQSSRLLADRQVRLRGALQRIGMLAARA